MSDRRGCNVQFKIASPASDNARVVHWADRTPFIRAALVLDAGRGIRSANIIASGDRDDRLYSGAEEPDQTSSGSDAGIPDPSGKLIETISRDLHGGLIDVIDANGNTGDQSGNSRNTIAADVEVAEERWHNDVVIGACAGNDICDRRAVRTQEDSLPVKSRQWFR